MSLRFIYPVKWCKQFYPYLVVALVVLWSERERFPPNQHASWMTEKLVAFQLHQGIVNNKLKFVINSYCHATTMVFHAPRDKFHLKPQQWPTPKKHSLLLAAYAFHSCFRCCSRQYSASSFPHSWFCPYFHYKTFFCWPPSTPPHFHPHTQPSKLQPLPFKGFELHDWLFQAKQYFCLLSSTHASTSS